MLVVHNTCTGMVGIGAVNIPAKWLNFCTKRHLTAQKGVRILAADALVCVHMMQEEISSESGLKQKVPLEN